MKSRRQFFQGIAGLTTIGLGLSAPSKRAKAEIEQIEVPVRAVTQGPKAHFFGYYDKCPWDQSGRYLLGMEIDYCDHQPEPGDLVTIGLIDLEDRNQFKPIATTAAWSWQQGPMLQWLGPDSNREVIFNALEDGQYVARVVDVFTGTTTRVLPRPIYAINRAGSQAVTLDYERLNRTRPGYGYNALPEANPDNPAPDSLGIYTMDLKRGLSDLIIPISWAAAHQPDDRFQPGAHHWFNHLQYNPSGSWFVFLHRWEKPRGGWFTRMYVARADGSETRLIQDTGMVSHFDWRDDQTLLAWSTTPEHGPAFYHFDIESGTVEPIGRDVLPRDGHCSYSPDLRWILNDTYPDKDRLQTLMIYDPSKNRRVEVGQFYLSPELRGPVRCDLHPRWNRDGTQVCIDSAHQNKTRQLYIVDVSEITTH